MVRLVRTDFDTREDSEYFYESHIYVQYQPSIFWVSLKKNRSSLKKIMIIMNNFYICGKEIDWL
mgnify:CR=1 FL=1